MGNIISANFQRQLRKSLQIRRLSQMHLDLKVYTDEVSVSMHGSRAKKNHKSYMHGSFCRRSLSCIYVITALEY